MIYDFYIKILIEGNENQKNCVKISGFMYKNLNELLVVVLWVFSSLTYSRFKWGRDNCFKMIAASSVQLFRQCAQWAAALHRNWAAAVAVGAVGAVMEQSPPVH